MITGFNTDIDFEGVTYHVQTEDKGLDTPLILSLVYDRGTILASKRSPYDDLLIGKFNEKELVERLNRQHKLICAAIKAGRIEDLKRMNAKDSSSKKKDSANGNGINTKPDINEAEFTNKQPVKEFKAEPIDETFEEETPMPSLLKELPKELEPIKKPLIELPKPDLIKQEILDTPIEITDSDLIFDDTQNHNELIVLSDDAVEIITAFSETEAPSDNHLFIEILNEVDFKGGDNKTVSLLVGRGIERNVLEGASLMVKVLGSRFRPLIFHTKTDSNGVATVNLQIPSFSRGRAAVLMKAMSNGDEVELRRVIYPD